MNYSILLTGMAKGLGRELAKKFIADGYKVIGIDIVKEDSLDSGIKEGMTSYYQHDLSLPEKIPDLVKRLFTDHNKIDVLINNAGIVDHRYFRQYSDQEIMNILNVNLAASILMTKHVLHEMIEREFGRIINISSNSAYYGFEKGTIYTPTKAGLILFSESLAAELAYTGMDISINCISPARIATREYLEMNPGISVKRLVSTGNIYKVIKRLINNKKVNGENFVLFPKNIFYKIIHKDIRRYLKWFFRDARII